MAGNESWRRCQNGFRLRETSRHSQQFDARWELRRNPCEFVIESRDGNFYYSGDTALTSDMKLIGETTKLDFAASGSAIFRHGNR